MTNRSPVPSKRDTAILETVMNSPQGTTAVLGFTMCILTGIIGICYLASQGCFASLSIGSTKLQVGPCNDDAP